MYVVVPATYVFITAGLQVPVMLLIDVDGSAGDASTGTDRSKRIKRWCYNWD